MRVAKSPCGQLPATNAQLHALRLPVVLANGCVVFRLDKREEPAVYLEATVVSGDRTLTPPSYVVRIGESEKETERTRLFVNRPTDHAS